MVFELPFSCCMKVLVCVSVALSLSPVLVTSIGGFIFLFILQNAGKMQSNGYIIALPTDKGGDSSDVELLAHEAPWGAARERVVWSISV